MLVRPGSFYGKYIINASMDNATIHRLNEINRTFYAATADRFEALRHNAWPGWKPLIPYLHASMSLLDVGCGNGRFGKFVSRHAGKAIHYHGIDSNGRLLEYAHELLADIDPRLEQRDIVETPPDAGQYDLVVAFGLLHHIPGDAQRKVFIRDLANRVSPAGLLAFACWRFYEYERFRQRIVPWPADIDVEPNDYLMDWRQGESALRYVHYVDDAEHAALIAATGFTEISGYRADGESGDANRYSLLRAKI